MLSDNIEYCLIDANTDYYKEAVNLRYKVFYQPTNTPINAVYDDLEDKSFHLVAILDNKVVGYVRLSIDGEKGQISQFVVEQGMRGKASIAKRLIEKTVLKAKESNVKQLWGEIRLHVAEAARIYGFTVSDEVFPSKKTGIPHRRIEKYI